MTYDEALAYLDEHATYEKTGRITSPSTDTIAALCAAMGDPQQPILPCSLNFGHKSRHFVPRWRTMMLPGIAS